MKSGQVCKALVAYLCEIEGGKQGCLKGQRALCACSTHSCLSLSCSDSAFLEPAEACTADQSLYEAGPLANL